MKQKQQQLTSTTDKLVVVAKGREATEGRKGANKAHKEEHRSMVLKGTADVPNARMNDLCTEVKFQLLHFSKVDLQVDLVLETRTLVYTFEDGQKYTIQG